MTGAQRCAPTVGFSGGFLMMRSDLELPSRRSMRWAGFDYAQNAAYFVTMCVHHRRCAFGRVVEGAARLHSYGEIARDQWLRTGDVRPDVVLDEFVVMPNHFHAILILSRWGLARQTLDPTSNSHDSDSPMGLDSPLDSDEGSRSDETGLARQTPTGAMFAKPVAGSLGTILGAFKSAVTRDINRHREARDLSPVVVWQRNYHDRVIRSERELRDTQRYIIENPKCWPDDELHPDA